MSGDVHNVMQGNERSIGFLAFGFEERRRASLRYSRSFLTSAAALSAAVSWIAARSVKSGEAGVVEPSLVSICNGSKESLAIH